MTFDPELAAARLRRFIQQTVLRDVHPVIGDDDALMTSGIIDSFALVDLLRFLEESFNIHVPERDLTPDCMNTIAMIVRYVQGRISAQ